MQQRLFFDKHTIEKAKAVSIPAFLQSIGIEPVKEVGHEWLYLSPLRSESTPSFFVNPSKNCFIDFGGSEEMKGDAIRLVQLILKCHFRDAIRTLVGLPTNETSFSFSGQGIKTESGLIVNMVRPLTHPSLIQYVEGRAISLKVASKYLKEVHFLNNDKSYFALGFRNDNDGFELRNGLGFKGKTANGITTFDCGTKNVAIFEGFFDFLSALEYYNKKAPSVSTIVLNTTNNLKAVLPMLDQYKQINAFLDNDKAGRQAVNVLKDSGLRVRDYGKILYPHHKDFNAYWCENGSEKVLKRVNGYLTAKDTDSKLVTNY